MANGSPEMSKAIADLLDKQGVGDELEMSEAQASAVLAEFGNVLSGQMFARAKSDFDPTTLKGAPIGEKEAEQLAASDRMAELYDRLYPARAALLPPRTR
jgi:hypothetical protein